MAKPTRSLLRGENILMRRTNELYGRENPFKFGPPASLTPQQQHDLNVLEAQRNSLRIMFDSEMKVFARHSLELQTEAMMYHSFPATVEDSNEQVLLEAVASGGHKLSQSGNDLTRYLRELSKRVRDQAQKEITQPHP
jgi:hypothetical protein